MNKAATITILFLIIQATLFAQKTNNKTTEIDKYTYRLDTTKSITDTISFLFDSIQVNAQVKINMAVATCFFEQSKSELSIHFYSRNEDLVSVEVKEQSPKMKDMYSLSTFYYETGSLFYMNCRRTVRPCMLIPLGESVYKLYGYNPNLNPEFLKKFVFLLYDKIIQQSTANLLL